MSSQAETCYLKQNLIYCSICKYRLRKSTSRLLVVKVVSAPYGLCDEVRLFCGDNCEILALALYTVLG